MSSKTRCTRRLETVCEELTVLWVNELLTEIMKSFVAIMSILEETKDAEALRRVEAVVVQKSLKF